MGSLFFMDSQYGEYYHCIRQVELLDIGNEKYNRLNSSCGFLNTKGLLISRFVSQATVLGDWMRPLRAAIDVYLISGDPC
jgi:hypothetical protein